MSSCKGCNEPLIQPRVGRRRMYCSGRCRAISKRGSTCTSCGVERAWSTTGHAPPMCRECAGPITRNYDYAVEFLASL